MRGEQVKAGLKVAIYWGSSPHARGAERAFKGPDGRHGIIPACAGSSLRNLCDSLPEKDHPRMRGEQRRFHRA